MSSDSHSYDSLRTVADTQMQTPERTVEDMLSSCTMRGAVSIPRRMRNSVAVLCIVLTLTLLLGSVLILLGGASMWAVKPSVSTSEAETGESDTEIAPPDATYPYADGKKGTAVFPTAGNARTVDASLMGSSHAVVVSVKEGKVVASLGADENIFPASMTKVMTLIVAVENLPHKSSLTDTVTVSQEVYDRMTAEGSSGVGLEPGEKLTVEALLYALMLKSDGIAACELARYVAGSEEAFVEKMNQKAAEMGLSGTHFENPTGLHHPRHKSTVRNVASMMAYAMDMQLCRRILTAKTYNAPCVTADGKQITYTLYHNLLVQQFEKTTPNQPRDLTVIAGKTGYTPESGYCLVTYAQGRDGNDYIAVTTKSSKYAGCISDYIALYNAYAKS